MNGRTEWSNPFSPGTMVRESQKTLTQDVGPQLNCVQLEMHKTTEETQ